MMRGDVFGDCKRVTGGVIHMRRSASSLKWIDSACTTFSELSSQLRQSFILDTILPTLSPESLLTLPATLSRHRHSLLLSMTLRDDIHTLTTKPAPAVEKHVPTLKALDSSLQVYLTTMFALDNLHLERVQWDTASGSMLDHVARGESVHRIRSLAELKRRLDASKRCFAFVHPAIPDNPIVFIHVGLTSTLASSLADLETYKEAVHPTHAMFYSINSPHTALRGLEIASLLIKEVATKLNETLPSLKVMSTLSPIPSFVHHLANTSTFVSIPMTTQ